MSKRDKRPSRLAWFAMDVDAFLEDPRMQTLTNKEKSAWALMLIRGFRNQGTIIMDPIVVAEQTGLTKKEAQLLIGKLYVNHLVVPTDAVYEAMSNRLSKEYIIAQEAYQQRQQAGIKSALKNGNANLLVVK